MSDFYGQKEILHQRSCVTTQQNGGVERKHQSILMIARSLLMQSKLPSMYWGYVVLHAVFLINRVPSNALKGGIPFHLLYGTLPDFFDLRVFGSLCFVSILSVGRSKLPHRAQKFIFRGYQDGMKGCITLNLHSKAIVISRNVHLYEIVFPYTTSQTHISWTYLDLTTTTTTNTFPDTHTPNKPIIPDFRSSPAPTSPLINSSPSTITESPDHLHHHLQAGPDECQFIYRTMSAPFLAIPHHIPLLSC